MFRKLFHQKSKSSRDGEGTSESSVDPSTSLAQAQEILGKLRDDDSIADPFPSLNEATRLVSQLDNHVRGMPAADSMKDIWMEQVSEVQKELQKVTESTVSKMSEIPRSPLTASDQRNSQMQGDSGMDDLFSGLSVSDVGNSAAPTTATRSKPRISINEEKDSAAGRPELDIDLFSDLVTVDPISLESVNTVSTAATPTAPESTNPTATSPQPRSPSVPPHSPQSYVSPVVKKLGAGGKKKKKINQIGYGRGPESAGAVKSRSSVSSEVTVNSVGSWVDVGLRSKALEEVALQKGDSKGSEAAGRDDDGVVGPSSAGVDLETASVAENRLVKSGDASPSHPAATAPQQGMDGAGQGKEGVQENLGSENSENLAVENGEIGAESLKNKGQLDDLRRRAAGSSASTEQALEKLKKKMEVLKGDELRSLEQLAKDKDKISELESRQTAAVENEDFEEAASLATEIDSLLEGVERCHVEIARAEKDLQSCDWDRIEIRQAQMDFLVDAVAEVGGLRGACQASSNEAREKMEEELKELEAVLDEKKSSIETKEGWLPEERTEIEKCRLTMEENAATRKEEKENRMADLRNQEGQLQMEIEQLKAELAAKEAALENVVVEMQDLSNSQDVKLEQELDALTEREASLAAEETQVAELKKEAEHSQAQCGANRERTAKLMEEYDAQMEELCGVSEKYEQQLESLQKVSKREKDLFELLSRLAESKSEAEKSRQQLEAENERQKEALKDFSSEIVSLGVTIRSLQEEIGKAEVRLPELDELKKAAAASKDFKEAASLSAQAKEIAAQKEAAEHKLTEATAHLSDIEQRHGEMTNQVSSLETRVEEARRASGLAQYVQLKSKLRGEKLGLIPVTRDRGDSVMELVCESLEADFQFSEDSISDSLKAIDGLADSC